eukprot:tig00000581_g2218.t1
MPPLGKKPELQLLLPQELDPRPRTRFDDRGRGDDPGDGSRPKRMTELVALLRKGQAARSPIPALSPTVEPSPKTARRKADMRSLLVDEMRRVSSSPIFQQRGRSRAASGRSGDSGTPDSDPFPAPLGRPYTAIGEDGPHSPEPDDELLSPPSPALRRASTSGALSRTPSPLPSRPYTSGGFLSPPPPAHLRGPLPPRAWDSPGATSSSPPFLRTSASDRSVLAIEAIKRWEAERTMWRLKSMKQLAERAHRAMHRMELRYEIREKRDLGLRSRRHPSINCSSCRIMEFQPDAGKLERAKRPTAHEVHMAARAHVRNIAATILQAVWRSSWQQWRLYFMRKRARAATKVQALVRRQRAWRLLKKLHAHRELRIWAATRIQKAWKKFRSKFWIRLLKMKRIVKRLKAWLMMTRWKKTIKLKLTEKRAAERDSAAKIQKTYRRMQTARTARKEVDYRMHSVVLLQSVARRYLAALQAEHFRDAIEGAAYRLQLRWKSVLRAREAREERLGAFVQVTQWKAEAAAAGKEFDLEAALARAGLLKPGVFGAAASNLSGRIGPRSSRSARGARGSPSPT